MPKLDPRLISDSRELARRAEPPRARPGIRRHFSSFHLHRDLPEVFSFFSEPRNLEALTPPDLGFKMIGETEIRPGATLRYRMRVFGRDFTWTGRIERWDPPFGFVDEQISGPFSVWHHAHSFTDEGDRVRVDDEVLWRVPLWPLGEIVAPRIESEIKRIFDYRRERLVEIFG